jgi:glycosyltransferase involved in cell wall biosynthesis
MITMTQRNADELKSLYGRESVVIFQGGNPPGKGFLRVPPEPGEPLVVLSACRIEPSKRIDWILEAVHQFNRETSGRQAVAVIVGRGSAAEGLRDLADRRGMGDSAQFLGEIPQPELEAAFARAALFAMPAIQGFGLPALEALYRRVPVVLHEDSGVAEALRDERMAVISRGSKEDFSRDLGDMLRAIAAGGIPDAPTTRVPTEEDWCEAIARRCGWLHE